MRKERTDYNREKAQKMYEANRINGMSINEITMNPTLNPTRVSQQRVHQIILSYERKLEK